MNNRSLFACTFLVLLSPHVDSTQSQPTPSLVPPKSDCGISLPKSCSCSPSDKGVSFSCFEAALTAVPKIDVGPKVIKTLNLGKNRLTTINMGDFYGLKITRLLLSNNSLSELPLLAFWGLEYHLETLDLSYNRLTSVPSDALKLLRNLRSLVLTANRISILRHFDFGYLRRLDILALDSNPIHSISSTAFMDTQLLLLKLDHVGLQQGLGQLPTKSLSKLQGLTLSLNGIRFIPPAWFKQMDSLRYLRLDSNSLKFITNETFTGIEDSLRTLELNGNDLLYLPVLTIRQLSMLEDLSIAGNRLRKILTGSFNSSKLLKTLDLSHNFISTISAFAFRGLDNVRRIDLRFNHLYTLDDRTLYWPTSADRQVFLSHNPWLCNCQIKWMKHDHKWHADRFQVVVDAQDLLCDRPKYLQGHAVVRTFLRDFTCTHDYFLYYFYEDPKDDVSNDFDDDYADEEDEYVTDDSDVIEMDKDVQKDQEVDDDVSDDVTERSGSGSGRLGDDDAELSSADYDDEINISTV
ncbi:hypothetical protein CAPTEDRAFT_220537 [Capitella teleta]|uniref:LRRCT domain-containing protein n=1 Tax=Capitella teleta TaxID=283909 RepID=R7UBK8_CAPTE|nr:hypothetical protein CAPTEDRAFT_220537 [Capitella teleta]|eukprot:ELU03369.1 hypothetical protein CAPTEDRAFT_220537 [Capitella teleta]